MTIKFLIIDAHPVYIHKTEGFLKSLTYNDITLAKTAQEGLEKLAAIKPDVVIMSGMLPDMNAHVICKNIKERADTTKIIVQVGLFTDENDIQRFKQYGADVVLDRKEKDLMPLQDAIVALSR
jgi:DNA-binding NarL/FixJ family response regulator